jgi:hypothetical protein
MSVNTPDDKDPSSVGRGSPSLTNAFDPEQDDFKPDDSVVIMRGTD